MAYLQKGIEYSLPIWGQARMASDNIRYMEDYSKNTGVTPKYLGRTALGGASSQMAGTRSQIQHAGKTLSKNLSDIY